MKSDDRSALIRAHEPLVRAEVRKAGILNPDDRDDAFQAGCVALLTAFDLWEGRGTFGAYARHAVRRAVLDCAKQSRRGPLAGIRGLPRAGGVMAVELDAEMDYADDDDDDGPVPLSGRLTAYGLVDKHNAHSVASDVEDAMIAKLDYERLISKKRGRVALT